MRGIFTNITPDHLDFHRSFDEYLQVKTGFFTNLPPEAPAVINIDDPHGRYILDRTSGRKFTYGLSPAAAIRAEEMEMTIKGVLLRPIRPGEKAHKPEITRALQCLQCPGCFGTGPGFGRGFGNSRPGAGRAGRSSRAFSVNPGGGGFFGGGGLRPHPRRP